MLSKGWAAMARDPAKLIGLILTKYRINLRLDAKYNMSIYWIESNNYTVKEQNLVRNCTRKTILDSTL